MNVGKIKYLSMLQNQSKIYYYDSIKIWVGGKNIQQIKTVFMLKLMRGGCILETHRFCF